MCDVKPKQIKILLLEATSHHNSTTPRTQMSASHDIDRGKEEEGLSDASCTPKDKNHMGFRTLCCVGS